MIQFNVAKGYQLTDENCGSVRLKQDTLKNDDKDMNNNTKRVKKGSVAHLYSLDSIDVNRCIPEIN